uniref:H15 domain-containing protein n=1 Tax=Photinus pyralis TaxID=7054 RepID=A0A1Y1LU61_PHOPY
MSTSRKETAQIILSTLQDISMLKNSSHGISERTLTTILEKIYDVSSSCRRYIKPALESGIKFGAIRKRGNKYYLGGIFPAGNQACPACHGKHRTSKRSRSRGSSRSVRRSKSKPRKGHRSRRRRTVN